MPNPNTLQTLRTLPSAVALLAAVVGGCSAPESAPAPAMQTQAASEQPVTKMPTCTKLTAVPDELPHSIKFSVLIDGVEEGTSPTGGYRVTTLSYEFGDQSSQDISDYPLKEITHLYATAGHFTVSVFANVLIDNGTPPVKSDVIDCPTITVPVS